VDDLGAFSFGFGLECLIAGAAAHVFPLPLGPMTAIRRSLK
jgi:hypothetical protein